MELSTKFFQAAIYPISHIHTNKNPFKFLPTVEKNITDGVGKTAPSGKCPFAEPMYATVMYDYMRAAVAATEARQGAAALGGRKRRTKNKRKNKKRSRRYK